MQNDSRRFAYLDNLRSFVIFLVVVMHSNVTYSGYGGWYYKEARVPPAWTSSPGSSLACTVPSPRPGSWVSCSSWPRFAAKSLAKRGPAAFVRDRLFRLGIPLLIYMFVIDPFIGYFIMNYGDIRDQFGAGRAYLGYLGSFRWIGSTGPLWFVEALLLFSLPYAALRALRPAKKALADPPKALTFVLIILATGFTAFSIRLFMPIGTGVANLQICYFASYVALFILGLHAGERSWLDSYPEKAGLRWFSVALGAGIPVWCIIMIAGGAARGIMLTDGGLYWQSFAFAFWEAFIAIGFSLGLIAFFRKYLDIENAFTRLLARNSFGVYMFHAPILIAISLLLKDWHAPLLLKHATVAPLAFALTLAASFLILRRIPGLKAVLK